MTTRRHFLRHAPLSIFGAGVLPGWLARAASNPGTKQKVLVSLLLRGAADGLNIVVPFGEKRYFELRPTLAVPAPGATEGAALDLNGFFGLHPAMAPLLPAYRAERLAFVHASGSPDATRSHFDAQDYMESGTPGRKSTPDGWLNRSLASVQAVAPLRAVSASGGLARSLRGTEPAIAIGDLRDFQVRGAGMQQSFTEQYAATADPRLRATAGEAMEAMRIVQQIERDIPTSPSADYPRGKLGRSLQSIAKIIKADVGLQVAFAEHGGWDHHVNEMGPRPMTGPLFNQLSELSNALHAFETDLGDRIENVVLVAMSEFGRTAQENGTRGTDHGHGNVMMLLGGPVRGGQVAGHWPGLAPEQLYEQRDLAITTDFRQVLSEVVSTHLGQRDIARVFPGYRPDPSVKLALLK